MLRRVTAQRTNVWTVEKKSKSHVRDSMHGH